MAVRIDGRKLRALREERGLNQGVFAERAGVDERTVRRHEREGANPAHASTARAYADVLRVEVAEILVRRHASAPRAGPRVESPTSESLAAETYAIVGRDRHLRHLRAIVRDVRDSEGHVVLISGEDGVGKRRLVEECARLARREGVEVWTGRGDRIEGAPAFQPWVEILTACCEQTERSRVARALEDRVHEVTAIAPRLAGRFAKPDEAVPVPVEDRFTVFDALTRFFARLSRDAVQMVVLENLHLTDDDSLDLFHSAANRVHCERILLVATFSDLERRQSVRRLVGDLAPRGYCSYIELEPLGRAETGALARGLRPDLSDAAIDWLHRQTRGLPLYIQLMMQHVQDHPEADLVALSRAALPETVMRVIESRLDAFDTVTVQTLSVAALIGDRFALDVLEAAMDPVAVGPAIDLATRARILRPTEPEGALPFVEFVDTLTKRALTERLDIEARRTHHGQIGRALEQLYAADLEPHLETITHHYMRAGRPCQREAVTFAIRSAAHATEKLAHEKAIACLGSAIASASGVLEARELCELYLERGDARHRIGAGRESAEDFARATAIARAIPCGELLARCALGAGLRWQVYDIGFYYADEVGRLEEALACVPPARVDLRAQLSARLALARAWTGESEEATTDCDEAALLARESGDPESRLQVAKAAYLVSALPDRSPGERRDVVANVRRAANATRNRDHLFHAQILKTVDALTHDVRSFDRECGRLEQMGEERKEPWRRWWILGFHTTRTFIAGDASGGDSLSLEQLELGRRAGTGMIEITRDVQAYLRDALDGEWERLDDVFPQMIRRYPMNPSWHCGELLLRCQRGHTSEARERLRSIVGGELDAMLQPLIWPVCAAFLAEVCFEVESREPVERLRGLLEPYAGQNIVGGLGVSFYGPTERFLGLLAATCKHWDESERLLRHARQRALRMHALPIALQIELDLVRIEQRRGRAGLDAKLRDVIGRAEECRWHGIARAGRRLLA